MNGLTEISAPYVETKSCLSLLIQINLVHALTSHVSKSNFNPYPANVENMVSS